MKRFYPIGLALLLILSSFGGALAAALCPRALGRECCFAKTLSHTHISSPSHENMAVHDMHMDDQAMDGMNMDDVAMDATSMDHPSMNEMIIDSPSVDMSIPFSLAAFSEKAAAKKFEQPIESCTHCLNHSGTVNAPVSFVCVTDQSGKETGSVLVPVSRFLIRPAIAPAQIGLPREHAPPGMRTSRHILISVFLI